MKNKKLRGHLSLDLDEKIKFRLLKMTSAWVSQNRDWRFHVLYLLRELRLGLPCNLGTAGSPAFLAQVRPVRPSMAPGPSKHPPQSAKRLVALAESSPPFLSVYYTKILEFQAKVNL